MRKLYLKNMVGASIVGLVFFSGVTIASLTFYFGQTVYLPDCNTQMRPSQRLIRN